MLQEGIVGLRISKFIKNEDYLGILGGLFGLLEDFVVMLVVVVVGLAFRDCECFL